MKLGYSMIAIALATGVGTAVLAPGAGAQRIRSAESGEEDRMEGVARPSPASSSENLGLEAMLETSRAAQEQRRADRESAEAVWSMQLGKMREKKAHTRERQEKARSEAWSNVAVTAAASAASVAAASAGADPEEDEEDSED
jgi:hypothetical protein